MQQIRGTDPVTDKTSLEVFGPEQKILLHKRPSYSSSARSPCYHHESPHPGPFKLSYFSPQKST